jgi:AcrR family transcriptional regulator
LTTGEGLRARKRRETRLRIIEAGIRLFIDRGYEAATLDEIAAAAGISRRSFFHYFRSKDEILLSLQASMGERIASAVRAAPPGPRPIETVRDAIAAIVATYPAEEMIAIDRIMRSSAAVQARKQASYVEHEATLLAALRERWPEPERAAGLRLVALLAIGAVRLATDTLSREGGARPLDVLVCEAFEALEAEVR